MTDSTPVVATPKWYEPSIYKLYVSSVNMFDKTSLKAYFCQFAEVVDIYMAEPNEAGFKWAFVYFVTEEGLLEAVSCVEKENIHNLKLSRAKPKVFIANYVKPTANRSVNGDIAPGPAAKLFNTNCANCKKITFLKCKSCGNYFCTKDCQLDGWRNHTGQCIQMSELVSDVVSNGHDHSISNTVVSYMKQKKASFTSQEFAAACNISRGTANVSPSVGKPIEEVYAEGGLNNLSMPDKRPHAGLDKGRKPPPPLMQQFPKRHSSSDNDETDKPINTLPEPRARTAAPKKFTKFNPDRDPNRQPFSKNRDQPNAEESFGQSRNRSDSIRQPFTNKNRDRDYQNREPDAEENLGQLRNRRDSNRPSFSNKNRDRDYQNQQPDAEENSNQSYNRMAKRRPSVEGGETHHRKPFVKQVPKSQDPDVEERANHRNNPEENFSFKKSAPDNSLKVSTRGKERDPKSATQAYQCDLKFTLNQAAEVIVTSIVNLNTFFVADPAKLLDMLKRIQKAKHSPPLEEVDIGTECLAIFDDEDYRARVVNTDPLEVVYIDYGNKEVCELDTLKVLPESLSGFLPLAAQVQLIKGDINEFEISENKEVTILVREYNKTQGNWIVDML